MTLVIALLGVLVGLGVVLLIVALRGTELRPARAPREGDVAKSIKVEHLLVRLAIGVVVGVVVALVTGWPVAALLLGAVGFLLPTLVGGRAAQLAKIERVEAIAAWAEMLRDTMAGAGGLEQSIIACSGVAPLPIRREVLGLAARLERDKLAPALRDFANELDDPTGDLVVAALVLAADKSPKRLGALLGMLAQSARAEVNMRLRVEAGRARTRTSVRVVTISTAVFVLGLVILNRSYLDAYDTLLGQLVMALAGLCFGGAFYWLAKASKFEAEERFLTTGEAA
ncbi:MAG: type II secretion system F family protein [Acidimicrobiales bacterium]